MSLVEVVDASHALDERAFRVGEMVVGERDGSERTEDGPELARREILRSMGQAGASRVPRENTARCFISSERRTDVRGQGVCTVSSWAA